MKSPGYWISSGNKSSTLALIGKKRRGCNTIPLLARGELEVVAPPPLRRWDIQKLNPRSAGDYAWETLFAAIRGKLAEPVPPV